MQRLFSSFPCGLPGAGLLLLRLVTAMPLVHAGLPASPTPVVGHLVVAGAAILLLIGLWTPLAGSVIAAAELGLAFLQPTERWLHLQAAVLAAALAMLGPGGCSLDARLFGRKQIEIPRR